MLLSIPIKAQEEFIKLCHKVDESPTEIVFTINSASAASYSAAIKDICGIDIWGSIVMEADRSFPEGIATCAGIPMFFKNQIPQLITE